MIDCVNERIYYKKQKHKRNKKFNIKKIKIFLIVFVLIALLIFYDNQVSNLIIKKSKVEAESLAVLSINEAVLSTTLGLKYTDLVEINKNDLGDVTFLALNTILTNTLTSNITIESKKILNNYLKKGIPINLGVFLGVEILSGYGKTINFEIASTEVSTCSFRSEFLSSGINQTLHRVYAVVGIKIDYIFSFRKESSQVFNEVLLCESVIVGKIPDVYLNN